MDVRRVVRPLVRYYGRRRSLGGLEHFLNFSKFFFSKLYIYSSLHFDRARFKHGLIVVITLIGALMLEIVEDLTVQELKSNEMVVCNDRVVQKAKMTQNWDELIK